MFKIFGFVKKKKVLSDAEFVDYENKNVPLVLMSVQPLPGTHHRL